VAKKSERDGNRGAGVEKWAPTLEGVSGKTRNEPPPRTKGSRVWKHFCWRCRLLNTHTQTPHTPTQTRTNVEGVAMGGWAEISIPLGSLPALNEFSIYFVPLYSPYIYRFCILQIDRKQTILRSEKRRYWGPHGYLLSHSYTANDNCHYLLFRYAAIHADVINWII